MYRALHLLASLITYFRMVLGLSFCHPKVKVVPSTQSIPTWLLKDCIDLLLPTLTDIMNASLDQGIFPSFFKMSLIHPLIKKDNLDADVFASYLPISNLFFLSNALERIVLPRSKNISPLMGYLPKCNQHTENITALKLPFYVLLMIYMKPSTINSRLFLCC